MAVALGSAFNFHLTFYVDKEMYFGNFEKTLDVVAQISVVNLQLGTLLRCCCFR